MRKCFVHIGTHRTATTTLQHTLARHAAALFSCNYRYPRTGRPADAPDGHHNLAWEAGGDARFRPEYGGVADLLAEIREGPHDVVLSSEDFECAAVGPHGLAPFFDAVRSHQFAVTAVVYLRNQIDYFESLYQVLVAFGCPLPLETVLRAVIDDGRVSWGYWIFPFCYDALLQRLEACPGVAVDARSFDRPARGALVRDFLSVLGLEAEALGIETATSLNVRPPLSATVAQFCANAKGTALDALEQQVIAGLCQAMGPGPLRLSERSRLLLAERFRQSNDDVRRRYGVVLGTGPAPSTPPSTAGLAPTLDDVFSDTFRQHFNRLTTDLRRARGVAAPPPPSTS